MERTYVSDAVSAVGRRILVQGFVDNLRDSKNMAFIVLKDITGKIQITIEKEAHPELCPAIAQLSEDSVISVIGNVTPNDYVKLNGVEVIPESIRIESVAEALPIARKAIPATKKKKAVERSSIDQRIDYRWIDLRTDENQLMFQIQTAMVNSMRQFLLNQNFLEIHTPKLIGAASESGADVFEVKYFDRNAYLAQSPQFYKQMAMASGFERIFEVGPVFRAEKSNTNRHTTEFTGFDLVRQPDQGDLRHRCHRPHPSLPHHRPGRSIRRTGEKIRLYRRRIRERRPDYMGGATQLQMGPADLWARIPLCDRL